MIRYGLAPAMLLVTGILSASEAAEALPDKAAWREFESRCKMLRGIREAICEKRDEGLQEYVSAELDSERLQWLREIDNRRPCLGHDVFAYIRAHMLRNCGHEAQAVKEFISLLKRPTVATEALVGLECTLISMRRSRSGTPFWRHAYSRLLPFLWTQYYDASVYDSSLPHRNSQEYSRLLGKETAVAQAPVPSGALWTVAECWAETAHFDRALMAAREALYSQYRPEERKRFSRSDYAPGWIDIARMEWYRGDLALAAELLARPLIFAEEPDKRRAEQLIKAVTQSIPEPRRKNVSADDIFLAIDGSRRDQALNQTEAHLAAPDHCQLISLATHHAKSTFPFPSPYSCRSSMLFGGQASLPVNAVAFRRRVSLSGLAEIRRACPAPTLRSHALHPTPERT